MSQAGHGRSEKLFSVSPNPIKNARDVDECQDQTLAWPKNAALSLFALKLFLKSISKHVLERSPIWPAVWLVLAG